MIVVCIRPFFRSERGGSPPILTAAGPNKRRNKQTKNVIFSSCLQESVRLTAINAPRKVDDSSCITYFCGGVPTKIATASHATTHGLPTNALLREFLATKAAVGGGSSLSEEAFLWGG